MNWPVHAQLLRVKSANVLSLVLTCQQSVRSSPRRKGGIRVEGEQEVMRADKGRVGGCPRSQGRAC
jgi:hypothetical protein